MKSLLHSFIVLECNGLWRPVHWLPGWKTTLYDIYTCCIMFLLYSVTLSEFFEFVRSMDDINVLADNTFMLLTMIGTCGKATNIVKKRNEIIGLTNALLRDPFTPKSEDELAIQLKFDEMVRSNTLHYAVLVGISSIAIVSWSLVHDIPRRSLPFNAWLPFEFHESLLGYSIVYSYQIVTHIVGAAVQVAFDCLVIGLMMQARAQLHILKHQFREMPILIHDKSNFGISNLESTIVSQSVRHHMEIFKFAKTLNDLFGFTIFLQFTVSTLVLCVSVLVLSKMELFSAEFMNGLLFVTCMLMQIFIYCFNGGDGTLESTDVCNAIYEMDWTTLSIKTKRSLLTIMLRTFRPIEFTSFYFITLNLDSFNSLLKLSYSAYNVLQQKG